MGKRGKKFSDKTAENGSFIWVQQNIKDKKSENIKKNQIKKQRYGFLSEFADFFHIELSFEEQYNINSGGFF